MERIRSPDARILMDYKGLLHHKKIKSITMVDELTQESFQTGKAIVTVSVDFIQAIAEACRKSEQNKTLNPEQKGNVLKKVVGFVTEKYKETHGSLKSFNKDGKDVAHLDVIDERTADIIKDVCKLCQRFLLKF